MGTYFKAIDRFAAALTRRVIAWRWAVIAGAVVFAVADRAPAPAAWSFRRTTVCFSRRRTPSCRPSKTCRTPTRRTTTSFFVLEPRDGGAFDADTLAAVEQLTEAAWQIPYAIRVDSVSNFQHTYAIEDDLIVEDLVSNAPDRNPGFLSRSSRGRAGRAAVARPDRYGRFRRYRCQCRPAVPGERPDGGARGSGIRARISRLRSRPTTRISRFT